MKGYLRGIKQLGHLYCIFDYDDDINIFSSSLSSRCAIPRDTREFLVERQHGVIRRSNRVLSVSMVSDRSSAGRCGVCTVLFAIPPMHSGLEEAGPFKPIHVDDSSDQYDMRVGNHTGL